MKNLQQYLVKIQNLIIVNISNIYIRNLVSHNQYQGKIYRINQWKLMKKILFPIQKLAMVFFYLEMLLDFDKVVYATLSIILMVLSLKFEGARLYTPLLFIIIILEMFEFSILQAIFVFLAGLAGVLFKIYAINLPIKGPYQMGHRYKNIQLDKENLLVSVFYPTLSKGSKTQWIPKEDYNKVLYEIFHVDPYTRRIPYRIFQFIVSYIHKIYLPAQHNSPYLSQSQLSTLGQSPEHKQNKQKIIIFSHGLGSHLNAYSSIFANWVGQGYTVISINHDHDEVCVDHRQVSQTDPYLIKDFLFQKRNRDLNIRVNQIVALIDQIQKGAFLKQTLGVDIKVKQIILGGHSFGGGTAVATKASINKRRKQNLNKQWINVSKVICLDPWFFPLEPETYEVLDNQDILIINSHYFYQQVPYIYALQKKFVKLKQRNPNIKAYMITGMDHIAQCDMAYVFGNVLQFTGSIKLYNLTDRFMALNILICHLFLEGKSKQQILEISNKFVEQKKMDFYKVQVKQEYRVTRQLTFGKEIPQNEQNFYDKI